MQCKYRVILSIDGGGIRGVVPLRILAHIQEHVSKMDDKVDISSWVDVFSASSTGSIIAGALMLRNEKGRGKFSPSEMLDLYKRRGQQIFSKNVGSNPFKISFEFCFRPFFWRNQFRTLA
jgi:patatin-like phospholipase/acyl hydrolase